jgi:uncharacterized ferredoxin-like protein
MSIKNQDELLSGGIDRALELMSVAANTALRFGPSKIKMVTIGSEEYGQMADFLTSLAGVSPLCDRDGRSFTDLVNEDTRALLIGIKRKSVYNFDCGACGYPTCKELNKAETVESLVANGPQCHFAVYDMHMAAMAAAALAWRLGLHCRVFQTMGTAATCCELIDDVDSCIGVGVSYQTQDPFFDRLKYWTQEEWAEKFAADFPSFTRGFIGAVE